MFGNSLGTKEALQDTSSVSEDGPDLSYEGQEMRAIGPDDQKTPNEQASKTSVTHFDDAPDGGLRAWLVVIAVTCILFSTLGFYNAWGVFQAYYQGNELSNTSPSNIAWIGSTQYALVYLPALVTGRLFDLGYLKIPIFAASCLMVVCTFLIAECKQYWQFFLAQGLGIGLAGGIMVGPALVVVSQWFSKKRGLALAFCVNGASWGSVVFPCAAESLIPLIGFKWTIRVFGFILLTTLGIANLLIQRRLPPANIPGGNFNFQAFRNKAYTAYCISGVLTFLGLYTVLTYISVSAVAIGISVKFSFYMLAIANAASSFGRLSSGVIAQKFGALNTILFFNFAAGIMTFAWPFAKNERQLLAIAVLYGFSTGGYVALYTIPIVAMGELEDAGRRVGMFMSISTLGAIAGPPISGALSTATGGYYGAGYYAGGITICSVIMLLVSRHFYLGSLWGKF